MTQWTVASRLPCPWDSPGKNTEAGCHVLLQGIFLTQGSNWRCLSCLLHWQAGSLPRVPLGAHSAAFAIANFSMLSCTSVPSLPYLQLSYSGSGLASVLKIAPPPACLSSCSFAHHCHQYSSGQCCSDCCPDTIPGLLTISSLDERSTDTEASV